MEPELTTRSKVSSSSSVLLGDDPGEKWEAPGPDSDQGSLKLQHGNSRNSQSLLTRKGIGSQDVSSDARTKEESRGGSAPEGRNWLGLMEGLGREWWLVKAGGGGRTQCSCWSKEQLDPWGSTTGQLGIWKMEDIDGSGQGQHLVPTSMVRR